MPISDALAVAPATEHLPLRSPSRPEGVRIVSRGNGRYFDLMPSQLSTYLLPTLADCSLLRREARSAAGLLRFGGGAVELEAIGGTAALDSWRVLLEGVDQLVGIGAIAQHTRTLVGQLGSGSNIARLFARSTAFPTAVTSASTETPIILPAIEQPAVLMPTATAATTTTGRVAPDASVSAVASRIADLAGIGDERLADLFKVERETFCRWRTGALTNPRVGNRRRLGLLLSLLEELAEREINIKNWLLNFVTSEGVTPYQLLEQGRIDDAAFLATSIGQPAPVERDPHLAMRGEPETLEFGDDDVWDDEQDDEQ